MAQKSVGTKYEVNDELMKKLDSGEIDMKTLDPETFAAVETYLDEKSDKAAPEEPPVAQPTADEPGQNATQDENEATKPPKGFVEGSRFKQVADKASDMENKWKAEQRRRVELEAKLASKEAPAVEKPDPTRVWSDDHQVDLAATVSALKAKVEAFENERRETLEKSRDLLKASQDEIELGMLRSKFGDAAPKDMNLEEIEKAYTDFYYATGATAEDASNVDKFFKDANFRKEMEAKGVKAPKNFEQMNTLLQAKALRDKFAAVDPDFKLTDAYVHLLAKQDKLSAMMTDAELKGAAKVAEKMHNIANETITMQPGLTSGTNAAEWSNAQIQDWLDKHPHPKTKDEIATFNRICQLLDARDGE